MSLGVIKIPLRCMSDFYDFYDYAFYNFYDFLIYLFIYFTHFTHFTHLTILKEPKLQYIKNRKIMPEYQTFHLPVPKKK